MSLPSIKAILKKRGVEASHLSPREQKNVLVEAMRADLGPALKFLHTKAHDAEKNGGSVVWKKSPNSIIGKQLIRIHASDALRPLAEKHFCHGKKLTFINCCNGVVGVPPKNKALLQLQCQDGTIAHSDC